MRHLNLFSDFPEEIVGSLSALIVLAMDPRLVQVFQKYANPTSWPGLTWLDPAIHAGQVIRAPFQI
jgi:inhibitor of KinA sporulation pathway (predicted exonuclease)